MEDDVISWKTLGEEGSKQFAPLGNCWGGRRVQTNSVSAMYIFFWQTLQFFV
jgi:hypothetical protein